MLSFSILKSDCRIFRERLTYSLVRPHGIVVGFRNAVSRGIPNSAVRLVSLNSSPSRVAVMTLSAPLIVTCKRMTECGFALCLHDQIISETVAYPIMIREKNSMDSHYDRTWSKNSQRKSQGITIE